jgi:hypothetical protein
MRLFCLFNISKLKLSILGFSNVFPRPFYQEKYAAKYANETLTQVPHGWFNPKVSLR